MLTILFLATTFFQNPDPVFIDRVAIKVNDKMITQRELVTLYQVRRKQLMEQHQGAELDNKLQNAWDDLIEDRSETLLLYEKAVELGYEFTEEDVRSRLNSWKESNGLSDEEFERVILDQTGMPFEDFITYQRREDSAQSVIQGQVLSQIQIDDSEIAKYYAEHQDAYMNPATYRIAEIVVLKEDTENPRAKVQEITSFLASGGDFAEAAQKYSDSASKESGGDLGVVEFGDFNQTIEDKVNTMSVGDVSEPLETDVAFFIIKLLERNPESPKPIQDVRQEIVEQLRLPLFESRYNQYIRELKDQYVLKVILSTPPDELGL